MTEWLDVVDQGDVVVGKASRREVHEKGLRHRSSHILVFNSDGQVFIQLRSLSKDNMPGLWDISAAGHVDSGESYINCAVRELYEELGIKLIPQDFQLVGQLSPSAENGQEFTRIFSVISDAPMQFQEDEIDAGKWLTPQQLNDWLNREPHAFTSTFLTIWQRLLTATSH